MAAVEKIVANDLKTSALWPEAFVASVLNPTPMPSKNTTLASRSNAIESLRAS